jgi:hypothetical protein
MFFYSAILGNEGGPTHLGLLVEVKLTSSMDLPSSHCWQSRLKRGNGLYVRHVASLRCVHDEGAHYSRVNPRTGPQSRAGIRLRGSAIDGASREAVLVDKDKE